MKKNSYNQGLAYYRHYYDPETWDFKDQCPKRLSSHDRDKKEKKKESQDKYFKKAAKPLLDQQFISPDPDLYAYDKIGGKDLDRSIILQTTYPGLLIGSGYAHGVGDVQGEHKIGFYFDHTSGRPIIPGSSVKGTLRSVFPLSYDDKKERQGRSEYLRYLLTDPEVGINKEKAVIKDSFIEALERDIFDGLIPQNGDQQLVMPSRDIFHDAILSGPENQTFLGNDFITPHNKAGKYGIPAELRNPIPIQFLKVLPGIQFTFQFYLPTIHYYRDRRTNQLQERTGYLLTPGQKILLFKAILLDMGIGAKTNVGYGQLIDPEQPPEILEFEPELAQRADRDSKQPRNPIEEKPQQNQESRSQKKKGSSSQMREQDQGQKTTATPKKIEPAFFRGKLNHKKMLTMDALVIKSGQPNEIEIFWSKGEKVTTELNGYNNPIPTGTVILVSVQLKGNLSINSLSFKDFKK